MGYSGARGTLFYEKNLMSKISCLVTPAHVSLTVTVVLYHTAKICICQHAEFPPPTSMSEPGWRRGGGGEGGWWNIYVREAAERLLEGGGRGGGQLTGAGGSHPRSVSHTGEEATVVPTRLSTHYTITIRDYVKCSDRKIFFNIYTF
jgi:hypothetical protein